MNKYGKIRLIGSFRRNIKMTVHEQLVGLFENYIMENQKFEEKGVKASAARARKALAEISKLTKARRAEIQEKKNSL